MICVAAVVVAFGVCYWQNGAILHLVNRPLAAETQRRINAGEGPLGAAYRAQRSSRDVARQLDAVTMAVAAQTRSPAIRRSLEGVRTHLRSDVAQLSVPPRGDRPVTLGIGEPFTTTLTVTLIFALIIALPVLLLQAYAFLMPAFEPGLRRRMLPITAAIPVLFAAGVAFGYLVVLPASLHFFQNFNASQFNVLVQASQYYKFAATVLLAMGLMFQIPVAVLAVTRAGLVTPAALRRNRRYAIVACCLVAAVLPGDAITMLLETLPLYILFEVSLLLASLQRSPEASVPNRPEW
jgi:sec-independent protein translocase protein TatC